MGRPGGVKRPLDSAEGRAVSQLTLLGALISPWVSLPESLKSSPLLPWGSVPSWLQFLWDYSPSRWCSISPNNLCALDLLTAQQLLPSLHVQNHRDKNEEVCNYPRLPRLTAHYREERGSPQANTGPATFTWQGQGVCYGIRDWRLKRRKNNKRTHCVWEVESESMHFVISTQHSGSVCGVCSQVLALLPLWYLSFLICKMGLTLAMVLASLSGWED